MNINVSYIPRYITSLNSFYVLLRFACTFYMIGCFSSHIRVLNHITKGLTRIPANKREVVFFVNQYMTSRKYIIFVFNKISLN